MMNPNNLPDPQAFVGILRTPREWACFVANAILMAGGKASTAFTCAALFAAGLEKLETKTP